MKERIYVESLKNQLRRLTMKEVLKRFLPRIVLVVVFTMGVLIGLVGFQSEGQAGGQGLSIALKYSDLRSLDPHVGTTTPDRVIGDMVFNGLVRYKPGDVALDKMEPDLAESIPQPKILPDGSQVWTFKLRHGVMFHPYKGNPAYELTSEDVVYSLKKAADPKRSAYAGEYSGMTFEAVDKYTVKITLEKAISPALFLPKVADYSAGFIVSKRAIEGMGDTAFKTHPVGTGPFMFKDYKPMEQVVLVRNNDYFRGKPHLEEVRVRFMPDTSSREMGLRKGELDVIEGVREQPWLDKVRKFPDTKVYIIGPGETIVPHFNMSKKPFDILEVRKAIAYALDRRKFVAFFGEEVSEPIYSFIPAKFLAGGLTKEEVAAAGLLYEFNIAKAKELLAKAGYPKGFSVELFTSESTTYSRSYELVQAQLREVGVDVKLSVVEHSTFHSMIRKDLSPIAIYSCWRPNADVFLTRFFHSNSIVVTGKKPDTNFSHYNQIDDLIERARVQADPAKQAELWKEAQIKMLKDMVAYSLIITKYVYGAKPYVDWGYELKSTFALYPQITEKTRISK
jgi:peptide/nickel transport system substrate-binding protein